MSPSSELSFDVVLFRYNTCIWDSFNTAYSEKSNKRNDLKKFPKLNFWSHEKSDECIAQFWVDKKKRFYILVQLYMLYLSDLENSRRGQHANSNV